ncbi:ABC transporter ATP-binding protein [Cesiribacter andamanensis]|uniref:Putative multidrug resistance ABC transporter ATP-binding/permease protein YheH n=1 Tax=Cesiribacter andamanensis AMV16 TaxID=1279009 RepID=M7N0M7_9BACT|nr:ABC transporter ATP-binding protein [Cesiribacter andamanensis]EMR02243.1 putative multidrug resistance ABC transporter ATP-binding/permease protein YheH [Cesiribacter andamanensis AMV16]
MAEGEIKSGNLVDWKVLRRLFSFAKPYMGTFWMLVVLTVVMAVLAPLRPWLIQLTIDDNIAVGDFEGLQRMMLLLVGLLLLQSVVQYFHTYLSDWLGQFVIRDLRTTLYRHLLGLRLKFFDRTPIGRLVTRTVSDIETLASVFSEGVAAIVGDLLQLVFIMGFMLYTDWRLTLVCLSTLPLLILSTWVFKEKIKVTFNDVRNAVANLNSFVQEHLTGMSIVQIFGSEKREYEKFKTINKEHRRANLRSVLYYSIYFPVAEVIQAMGIGLLVWYGARQVINAEIEPGVLVAFILYIQMFFRPIRLIADRFNTLQMGVVSSERIMSLLDSREHLADTGIYMPEHLQGAVQFKGVWFAYEEPDWVLKDISFEAKPGETIALVGATGAGKSSIINLLNRFYEYQQGEICIDGRHIRDFDIASLRRSIGVVLQDVFLFSDTIGNNISLNNPDISLEKMKQAADLVGARKFIERLPGGFEYNVMERGATLSVGQRQLISFVRALVYDPRIIILDEATSSVDTETEEMIQAAIEKLMKGRTSLVIAHRLSTIQKADKIIVLDRGEIKEEGTHEELLAKGGWYANLYRMQYKEVV